MTNPGITFKGRIWKWHYLET